MKSRFWIVLLLFGFFSSSHVLSVSESLEVESITPSGEQLKSVKQIVISFSKPVVELGAQMTVAKPEFLEVKPEIACQWRWLDQKRIACEMRSGKGPANATQYTVKIKRGLKSLDGAALKKTTTNHFSTVRPSVQGSFIEFVAPGKPIFEIKGEKAINEASLSQLLYFEDSQKRRHKTSVQLDVKKSKYQWNYWRVEPINDLPLPTRFRLKLKSGLQSSEGPLRSTKEISFGEYETTSEFKVLGLKCALKTNWQGEYVEGVQYDYDAGDSCDYGSTYLVTSSPVNSQLLKSKLQVTPVLEEYSKENKEENYVTHVHLSGLFGPGESYQLKLVPTKTLKDKFGRPLNQQFKAKVKTNNLPSNIWYPSTELVLEQSQDTDAPLSVLNVDKVIARSKAESAMQTKTLGQQGKVIWQGKQDNMRHVIDTGFREILGKQSGSIEGAFYGTEKDNPFYVQTTPFNVFTKVTPQGYWVWVTRLSNAKPESDAKVRIYSAYKDDDYRIYDKTRTFKTDISGLVFIKKTELDFKSDKKKDPLLWVEVKKGNDIGILRLKSQYRDNQYYYGYQRFSHQPVQLKSLVAWASSAQPLYQPGNKVQFKIFGRELMPDGYRVPKSKYTLSIAYHSHSADELFLPGYKQKPIEWSEFGTYSGEAVLPDNAPHSEYMFFIEDESGSEYAAGHFYVSEFNKHEFSVSAQVDKGVVESGKQTNIKVSAVLQNGGAYSEAPVSLKASIWDEGFEFDDELLDEFQFDSVRSGYNPKKDAIDIFEVKGKTSANGNYQYKFTSNEDNVYFGLAEFEYGVEDARGKAIEGYTSAEYFSRDRFVGARFSKRKIKYSEKLIAEAIVINQQKQVVKGIPVTLEIFQDQYYETPAGYGEKEYDWKRIHKCNLVSKEEVNHCSIEVNESAHYKIRAGIKDTQGRIHQTSTERWINVGIIDPFPKAPMPEVYIPETVEVGDQLEIRIDNPEKTATALVSIERGEVLAIDTHFLRQGENKILIPVTQAMLPDVTAAITVQLPRSGEKNEMLFGEEDIGKPRQLTKKQEVSVTNSASAIKLNIKSDKSTYAPGEKVELSIQSSHSDAVEASIVVVDQSLLDLDMGERDALNTNYQLATNFLGTPNTSYSYSYATIDYALINRLIGYSYRGSYKPDLIKPYTSSVTGIREALKKALDLKRLSNSVVDAISAEDIGRLPDKNIAQSLMRDEEVVVTGIRGALADPDWSSSRKDFRDLALWLDRKVIASDKTETVSFTLPDNLTRWKVIVLALDQKAGFGVAESEFTTNKATEVRAALPNQLVIGDKLDARFTVLNRDKQNREISYQAKIEEAVTVNDNASLQGSVQIDNMQRSVVEIPVTADRVGVGKFSLAAQDSIDSDIVTVKVPVNDRVITESASIRGLIDQQTTDKHPLSIPFKVPGDAIGNSAQLALSFSASRLDDIAGALSYGRDYPFTCWEQQLSRAILAAMYLRSPEYIQKEVNWPNADNVIQQALNNAAGFQAYNGGMAFFSPFDEFANPYLSAYTLVGFNWLTEWGYIVPEDVEGRLTEYLSKQSKTKTTKRGNSIGMALPLLIQRSIINSDSVDKLLPQIKDSSVTEKIYRLSVQPFHGQKELNSNGLLRSLQNDAYQDSYGYSFPLASTAVDQCSLLSLLIQHTDTFKKQQDTIEWLAESTRKLMGSQTSWRNTQENVFCAKALMEHEQYFNETPLDMQVTASRGEYEESVSLKASKKLKQPLPKLDLKTPASGKSGTVTLNASGSGKAYYTAQMQYKKDVINAEAVANGFAVQREYKIKQGDKWIKVERNKRLKRGQIVRVELNVTVPTERVLVALVDPLPGNLEAMNPALATEGGYRDWDEMEYEGYNNYADYIFYNRELGLQSVRFYAEEVPAGEYMLSYTAQVIATGEFTALPTKIEEMYAPEIYGRGTATRLYSH